MTGFGICNHTDYGYGLDMQPLVPVLVGADDIFSIQHRVVLGLTDY